MQRIRTLPTKRRFGYTRYRPSLAVFALNRLRIVTGSTLKLMLAV